MGPKHCDKPRYQIVFALFDGVYNASRIQAVYPYTKVHLTTLLKVRLLLSSVYSQIIWIYIEPCLTKIWNILKLNDSALGMHDDTQKVLGKVFMNHLFVSISARNLYLNITSNYRPCSCPIICRDIYSQCYFVHWYLQQHLIQLSWLAK